MSRERLPGGAARLGAAALLLAAGCGGRMSAPAPVPLPVTADTGVVSIEGPTLIAFCPPPTTATLADSAEVRRLEEFRTGVGRVRQPFERAGVKVYEQYTDTLAIRERAGGLQIYVPDRADGIGYYLVAPGRSPEILQGLQSETSLRDAVWRYFHGHGRTRQALR